MQQLPCVHGHGDVGFAGIGKHEAGVLVAALALAQLFLPGHVPGLHLRHLRFKFLYGFPAQFPDAGRHDVAEALFQAHIALALHRKAGDAVAGQLGQQRPAHPGHAEGEGSVLQYGQMAGSHDAPQERRLILFVYQFFQFVIFHGGIARPRRQGAGLFRFGGRSQQLHLQVFFRHRFILLLEGRAAAP